jgi:hypothetical protein
MCLSPEVSFEKLWINLCVLRRVLKCDLPIELWLFGQPDIMRRAAPLLEGLSVRVLGEDALPAELARNAWSGHAAKALAIAHSSFEDVLFLDADTCPVRDPTSLFEELAYRWSGAIVWPDILRTDPGSGIWSVLRLPFVDEPEWRGSQLVVNKARSWRPLCLLDHLTRHHGFYDPHTRDGKLAFYAAWKALDHPYAMTRQAAECVGAHDGEGHLNQCDLRGQLLFQGRAEAGWAPPLGNTDAGAHFVHRDACAAFAQELRERWPEPQRRPQQALRAPHERPSWRQLLQAAPKRIEPPAERQWAPAETWDAMALAVLRSPDLVAPSTMGIGIEALAGCSETEARAVFRLFAALLFADSRLAAMLPQDLDVGGTSLERPWDRLVAFADALQSRGEAFGLIGVRGDCLAREADPLLTHDEKALLRRLNDILAECETDIWRRWIASWRPLLAAHASAPEDAAIAHMQARERSDGPARPWRGKARHDTVLILTPIKDAADLAGSYCGRLERLNYPPERLSLGILESDSLDGTYEAFDRALSSLRRRLRRVALWKRDFGYRIPAGLARWEVGVQLRRRQILAQSRNELLERSLKDEDWVLWLDVDVVDYPLDIIEQLLSYGKDILHPHCVFDYGGRTFDRNAWREHKRIHMADVRGRELLAPLDAVGGTMLLVRADLHRKGLIFPVEPYGQGNPRIRQPPDCHDPDHPGEIETEGLGIMALDMNTQCWGLPELEILHRKR